jgi:predicted nucleotidyltransferase
MLENILGSRSKIRILRSFMKDPKRGYSMEDIVKDTGMSYGTVHPAMQDLVESRILLGRKIGRSIEYRINKSHVLFTKLRALFRSEASAFKEKAQQFADRVEKKGIVNIILFGSVARGEVIDAGDIDLLFIYSNPNIKKNVEDHVMDFVETYDILISPVFISQKDTKRRMEDLDDFILQVLEEGLVLYGDEKWLRK